VRIRSIIAVLVAVAVVALLVFGLISKGNSRLAVGEVAPSPSLPKLDEPGDGSLKEYRGKWVLVNFWASWCIPCRDEAPALTKFQQEHGGSNFTVVGIDTQDITTGVPESYLLEPDGKLAWSEPRPVDAKILEEQVVPLLPPKAKES
jgi:thiol-disulfide isomerase/thioredoxin